jgi:hypothetical protein
VKVVRREAGNVGQSLKLQWFIQMLLYVNQHLQHPSLVIAQGRRSHRAVTSYARGKEQA